MNIPEMVLLVFAILVALVIGILFFIQTSRKRYRRKEPTKRPSHEPTPSAPPRPTHHVPPSPPRPLPPKQREYRHYEPRPSAPPPLSPEPPTQREHLPPAPRESAHPPSSPVKPPAQYEYLPPEPGESEPPPYSPFEPTQASQALPPLKTAITRYPDISFRDKAALRQRCYLRVAVTQEPTQEEFAAHRMKFYVPSGEAGIMVDVLLTAEDFEIVGEEYQMLFVPVEKDSEPIVFTLIPQAIGIKKIKVEFFQDNKYIGGITTTTRVVMPEEASDANPVRMNGVVKVEGKSLPPDLTILITERERSGDFMRYQFKLHSPQNGLFYRNITEELVFHGSPTKWIEGLYDELASLSQNEGTSTLPETLRTIGVDLFEKLFPKELKDIWHKNISGKVKHIMIISDEPWIPWEVIRPSYEMEGGDFAEENFLCEDYQLTRWIAGPPPPCQLEIERGAVVAPLASNLPNVAREVAFLTSRFRILGITPQLEIVRDFLKTGGVQLIHFACHGSFDPEEHEQSAIYLEDGKRLLSRDIAGERRNFGRDKPFVFINACQTARADFSLVGIGSWADKFINSQASGFLGSSWEVNDELAYQFSQAFYRGLLEGQSIGEAVQKARLLIKNDYDSTWLAYCVYADPLARVTFL